MLSPRTPGVYIEEISKLPASVAPVATAIPAFIGFTRSRERNGRTLEDYEPVRIASFLEYQQIFGGAFDENYNVEIDSTTGDVSFAGSYTAGPYLLYYAMQMYFANGGGPCYVVSTGVYDLDTPEITAANKAAFISAIDALEKEDEPTILVAPEITQISTAADRKELNDKLLGQCRRLQDRFALLDVVPQGGNTVKQDGDGFRNNDVSIGNLNYGAAYYPYLKSSVAKFYDDDTVNISYSAAGPFDGESLSVVKNGGPAAATSASATINFNSRYKGVGDQTLSIGGEVFTFNAVDAAADPARITVGASAAETAQNFADKVNADSTVVDATVDGAEVTLTAKAPGVSDNTTPIDYAGTSGLKISSSTLEGGSEGGDTPDLLLYNKITEFLGENKVVLPPSAAIAGIYARVDRTRGVWKAPANVDVRQVVDPTITITTEEQDDLNVDPGSGKSINAIRRFAGKGVLVWGSRTLAGNDNEWRYVPVRRLFIFVEESVKKATEPVVFEPNTAPTWQKIKGMIENFLTSLWRAGALAGAAPEDAFFVRVGLGQTMTSQDILEGILNVEIGMAAVRPAEFIILKFSHKLQES